MDFIMANEIQFRCSIKATTNGQTTEGGDGSQVIDWAGSQVDGSTQTIGTTHEAVTVNPDLGTPGLAAFTNLDATNFAEIGIEVASTFYPTDRIPAGGTIAKWLVSGVTYYARANTAAVVLKKTILEE